MENNSILIEHETNELYRVYKDVAFKTENAKTAYIDLTKKNIVIEELYKKSKTELDTLLRQIADEKISWAQEKAEEWRKIDEKNFALDNALKLKSELNIQQEEIRVSTEKGIQARDEARTLELNIKNNVIALDAEKEAIKKKEESINNLMKKHENNKKDFKEKIIKLITNFE